MPKKFYRQMELNRIIHVLLAKRPMLVLGELGIGKSTLASAVIEKLQTDGFQIAFVEPTSPKRMLIEIAEQLEMKTRNTQGKLFSAERLKLEIKEYLHQHKVFLIVDDAHTCSQQFWQWLKELVKKKIPILLFATSLPRRNGSLKILSIKLEPLPE
jgi:predicted ATP-dependent serine protease